MFLDFEKPIEDIEEKILLLKNSTSASLVDLNSDIEKLQQKKILLLKKFFLNSLLANYTNCTTSYATIH